MKDKLTAQELYNIADKYVTTNFNYIQLSVLEKMSDGARYEYIDQVDIDFEDFINNYQLGGELLEHLQENYDDVTEGVDLFKEELFINDIEEFCENHENFDSYREDQEQDNYPMWNTCFEFRHEPSEDEIKAATDAGLGIIRDVEGFNTLLFASGCGYSFYGAHWIPMIIELNMFGDTKERSKGVKYDMM